MKRQTLKNLVIMVSVSLLCATAGAYEEPVYEVTVPSGTNSWTKRPLR